MQLTAFETGERSPGELIPSPDPSRKRERAVPYPERQRRKRLATRAVSTLGNRQLVADAVGLHPTAVTRWVQGQATVPAKHLPALQRIVERQ